MFRDLISRRLAESVCLKRVVRATEKRLKLLFLVVSRHTGRTS
jgi:hypothetical protein